MVRNIFPFVVLTVAIALPLQSAQTLVGHAESWRYHKGTNAPQSDWKTAADASLNATLWGTGAGGFGYADNTAELAEVRTPVPNNPAYTTLYIRKTFEVTSPGDPTEHLILTMDFDDGFIAWLDGNYLTSRNSPSTDPAYSDRATTGHESSRGSSSTRQPILTNDLGEVGTSLAAGAHVLSIIGLNDQSSSSDLILIADLATGPPPPTPPGTIATNTTWALANSPIVVSNNVTINSGVTLTIEPGVIVQFNQGLNMTINGRLLAEGDSASRIRFTRSGTAASWGGMTLNGGAGSPETRITYADFDSNSATALHSSSGTLFLEHVDFHQTDRQYLSLDGSSFVVRDCLFPSATGLFENVHGTAGIKSSGHGVFVRNFFGVANSVSGNYNDVLDFTGGNRPGPIIQFIDNVFIGSDDDCLDLDSTDAWVEGNIFMHTHKNGSPDSSSAVSGGADNADTSQVTIIGNIIYDCDHAAMGKQGNFFTLLNNTIVHITRQGGVDPQSSVVLLADIGAAEGAGMFLEGNIIYDAEALVGGQTSSIVTYTNNIIFNAGTWTGPGGNNSNVDPLFMYVPQNSETSNFTTWASAQIMRQWFSLQANSPAIGTGPNGRDKGGVIPIGASISGEPAGTTTESNATLSVGVKRTGSGIPTAGWPNGSGYTDYKWRLDGGAWSAGTAINTPIVLTALGEGEHQVDITGKRDSGFYQDDSLFGPDAFVTSSRRWTVSSGLRIAASLTPTNTINIDFEAQPNRGYRIEYRESLSGDLSPDSWQTLIVLDPVASAHHVSYNDARPLSPSGFYRVARQ